MGLVEFCTLLGVAGMASLVLALLLIPFQKAALVRTVILVFGFMLLGFAGLAYTKIHVKVAAAVRQF